MVEAANRRWKFFTLSSKRGVVEPYDSVRGHINLVFWLKLSTLYLGRSNNSFFLRSDLLLPDFENLSGIDQPGMATVLFEEAQK
jgi:hypothetical protein